MVRREHSVRGGVTKCWEKSGKQKWDDKETLEQCIAVDSNLEREGYQTAPKFRKAVKLNNQKYLMNWVMGCHFPWLNPR
jgi:hypothetical protein